MHATRRPLAVITLFAIAAATATWASAQNQLAPDGQLDKEFREAMRTFQKLRSGEQQPAASDKEKVMDPVARYLVYRYASPTLNKNMGKLRTELVEYQVNLALNPEAVKKNGAFREQFGASLAAAFRKLFENDFQEYRYPIVNAAPILVDCARLRSDAFADFLADLIAEQDANKKVSKLSNMHDVIKLYAVRALREYYGECLLRETTKVHGARPIVPQEANADNVTTAAQKKMTRDVRYISALLKFAENRPGVGKLPPEEQEAVRMLRKEAIETLAATQAPLVVHGKKLAEAPIAPLLLRVLSPKSDLDPPPSLAEKVEAAIGVCQIKYKNVPDYQPEVGVYLVGQLLHEFVTAGSKDVGPINNGKPAEMLWRTNAKRLELALKDLAVNAKGNTVESRAKDLDREGVSLLKQLLGVKTIQAANQGQLNAFRKMVTSMRPKTDEAFKDLPASKIQLGD